MSSYGRYRRQLLVESIHHFWSRLRRNRKGLTGLFLLGVVLALAVAGPLTTPFDPDRDTLLADPVVPPEWAAILPGYAGLPPNIQFRVDPGDWKIASPASPWLRVESSGSLQLLYQGDGVKRSESVELSYAFTYDYRPPRAMTLKLPVTYLTDSPYNLVKQEGIRVRFSINITRGADGRSFILHDSRLLRPFNGTVNINTQDQRLLQANGFSLLDNLAEKIFEKPGAYTIRLRVLLDDLGGTGNPRASMAVGSAEVRIRGRTFGLLGTDYLGRDVWTLFVYGARPALLAGVMVGLGVVGLGMVIGLISGYRGGFTDRSLMFMGDTMTLLPTLPMILLGILIFGRNIWVSLAIVIIFGAGYAGVARQLRAWVLSIKERPFVESARAIGCSDTRIMFRYVLPQTAPFLLYAFVLAIPNGIFLVFALEILGLGDPKVPSWGRTLGEAWNGGAILANAWWWLTPPLIGVFMTALAFILIGYALDEIVNPRLRTR